MMNKITFKKLKKEFFSDENKTLLITQNKTESGRENFVADEEYPNRYMNGDWRGLPRRVTDYIAHWDAKESILYIGKKNIAPIPCPLVSKTDKQRYKIVMDDVKIYKVTNPPENGSTLQNLLGHQLANVYNYWPKDARSRSDTRVINKQTGGISRKSDQLAALIDKFESEVKDAKNLSLSEIKKRAVKIQNCRSKPMLKHPYSNGIRM